MRVRRVVRDLTFGLVGAGLMACLTGGPDHEVRRLDRPFGAQADRAAEMTAWTLRDPEGGVELLAEGPSPELAPCSLPGAGRLRPVLDEHTGLPRRVAHWIKGGPRLWLMQLEPASGAFDASALHEAALVGPRLDDVPESCPSGRVLVPAEAIMSFLYARAAHLGEQQP